MIFCERQLIKKAREHNTQVYILFVDPRKAYDSVPREASWLVLYKYGIPPMLVNIIKSLHEGKKAEVTVDGQMTPEFEVNNGLRQGCTITSTLFNLYFNMVIMCGGKLIGERAQTPQ